MDNHKSFLEKITPISQNPSKFENIHNVAADIFTALKEHNIQKVNFSDSSIRMAGVCAQKIKFDFTDMPMDANFIAFINDIISKIIKNIHETLLNNLSCRFILLSSSSLTWNSLDGKNYNGSYSFCKQIIF